MQNTHKNNTLHIPPYIHLSLIHIYITDKKELQIRDAMGDILKQLPLDLSKKEDAFSKDLLLLMLKPVSYTHLDVYKRQHKVYRR